MAERTTPDPGVLWKDASPENDAGDNRMTIQHTHADVTAQIFIQGADTPFPTYMVCYGRLVGEPAEDTEARWNRLAEAMWRWGLEPPEDEPFFTVVEDGVVWDHYTLRPIYDYDHQPADERPLHV